MVAPIPSKLDERQILQNVHDEATGTLRTTSQATILNADISVAIDYLTDSIVIKDTNGDALVINSDGSINANIVAAAGIIKSKYTEVLGVTMGLTTLIGTYTAIADVFLQKVAFSGTNIAEYEVVINGLTQDKARTYFGNSLNGEFNFGTGLKLVSGNIVQVYVIHNRPTTGDFNSRIQTAE